ncbi:MAG: methionyl-tRNA formyltransferase [Acidobacteria bacterium]|nr:methionyl-tRNA formyltransferase [Acidobacteriota bacterium]MCB9399375.1 methionyl-tRNA formyltransferase [Acidobacteriota bacterium]
MKIAFMGTPEFAVPSLKALAAHFSIAGVFCQPDRPKGRSGQPSACPVKQAALMLDLPVFQPARASAPEVIQWVLSEEIDWLVVAAYGQILSQALLDAPRLGCVNVHASLLPRWRGASPIHHVLLHGESETGISLMGMVQKLDAGPVYVQAKLSVGKGEGRSALESRLAELGANLLVEHLPNLHTINPQIQDESQVTYAPIIKKAMGNLDWNTSATELCHQIRAFEGWPGVWATFRDQAIRIDQAEAIATHDSGSAGHFLLEPKKELLVRCANQSALRILKLQPAAKKLLTARDFINGFRPQADEPWSNGNLQ